MTQLSDPPPHVWKTIRVFISSTFRDFHAERDYLIKYVFPELRDWCMPYKLHLVDIDLRWGVTQAEAESGKVIDICLEQIDGSRPFFVCMLGNRYGWVPEDSEVPDHTFDRYNQLHRFSKYSVTHLEIEHAVFGSLAASDRVDAIPHSFFYFRDPQSLPEKSGLPDSLSSDQKKEYEAVFFESNESGRNKLAVLKADIIKHFKRIGLKKENPDEVSERVFNYAPRFDPMLSNPEDHRLMGRIPPQSLKAFGNRLKSDLKNAIQLEFHERIAYLSGAPRHPLEEHEREFNDLFVENRTRSFTGRQDILADLMDYISCQEPQAIMLTGPSGCGKSAILARFYRDISPPPEAPTGTRNREDTGTASPLVFAHFIGSSPNVVTLYDLLRVLCREMLFRRLDAQKEDLISGIRAEIAQLSEAGNELSHEEIAQKKENLKKSIDALNNDYAVPAELPDLIIKLDFFLGKMDLPSVFILDGINQLIDFDRHAITDWLPRLLPDKVKIILSRMTEDNSRESTIPGLRYLPVSELTISESKQIIRELPSVFAKSLEPDQMDLLFQKKSSGNPLYLKIALEELRVFGSHEGISNKIKSLPEDICQIFIEFLARLEHDFGRSLTRKLFSYLDCSRQGLTEAELIELLKDEDRQNVAKLILRTARDYLMYQGEFIRFFHQTFSRAVREKYFAEPLSRRKCHGELACYFKTSPLYLNHQGKQRVNQHKLGEQIWQQINAGQIEDVESSFLDYPLINLMQQHSGIDALLTLFEMIPGQKSHTITALEECLKQARYALHDDNTQLGAQLYARLKGFQTPDAEALAGHFSQAQTEPWLKLLGPRFITPLNYRMLRHHTATISSIHSFPGGNRFLSTCYNGKIVLWDLKGGRTLQETRVHSGRWIMAAGLSETGDRFVSADRNGRMAIWDAAEKLAPLQVWEKETDTSETCGIFSAALSSDTGTVLYGKLDGSIVCCDDRGDEKSRVNFHSFFAGNPDVDEKLPARKPVSDLNINTKQGTVIAYSEYTQTAVLLSLDTFALIEKIVIKGRGRTAFAADRRHTVFAYGFTDGVIRYKTMGALPHAPAREIKNAHSGRITVLEFYNSPEDPHDIQLCSAGTDGLIKLWKLSTGACLGSSEPFEARVTCLTQVPGTRKVIAGTLSGDIILCEAFKYRDTYQDSPHETYGIDGVALSQNGKKAVSFDEAGGIVSWRVQGAPEIEESIFVEDRPRCCDMSVNGAKIVFGTESGILALWDPQHAQGNEDAVSDTPITCCRFCDDDQTVIIGNESGRISLHDSGEMNPQWSEYLHHSPVTNCFMNQGAMLKMLVSTSWEKYSIAIVAKVPHELWKFNARPLSISSQGDLWIHKTRTALNVVNTVSGQTVQSVKGSFTDIAGACFSPCGDMVAAWSNDTVYIWEICTPDLLGTLTLVNPIRSLGFNGNRVILGHTGGIVSFISLENPIVFGKRGRHYIQTISLEFASPPDEALKIFNKTKVVPLNAISQKRDNETNDEVMVRLWSEAVYSAADSFSRPLAEKWASLKWPDNYLVLRSTRLSFNAFYLFM